jgi:hypothetical protein
MDIILEETLTVNNADKICELIRKILNGKKFVYTVADAGSDYELQIFPDQSLKPRKLGEEAVWVLPLDEDKSAIVIDCTFGSREWVTFWRPCFRLKNNQVMVTQENRSSPICWFTVQSSA